MKKTILLLITIFLLTGCNKTINTPTSKVESFLSDYQNLSPQVLENLKEKIQKENLTKEQKTKYQAIMEKQYQNLSYKIKNEEIIKNTAIVEVEIEVLNYNYSLLNSKKYFKEHEDEIKNYNDFKLDELEKVTSKIKYDIKFNLTQYDGVWELNELDKYDLEKIHGLY